MSGIYHRVRGPGERARRPVRNLWPVGGRARVVLAATAATVLAVAAGVVWGLAGADQPPSRAAGVGPQVGAPGGSPGAELGPLGSLDPRGGGGSSTGGGGADGGGPPGGAGSGSGSSGGGGPAGNRPPVIEDPGVSSDGMTLTIAPTVTDPDGDEVEVGYDDGSGLVLVSAQPTRTYPVRDAADGYRHLAEVTIHAIDAHGAVTRQTVSHQLTAISTVVVRRVDLKVESPQSCFATTPVERFTADLRLRGVVVLDRSVSEELRLDRATASLLPAPVEAEVIGERPRQDLSVTNATLAGARDSFSLSDIESPVRPRRMFLDSRCQVRVSVGVQVNTR